LRVENEHLITIFVEFTDEVENDENQIGAVSQFKCYQIRLKSHFHGKVSKLNIKGCHVLFFMPVRLDKIGPNSLKEITHGLLIGFEDNLGCLYAYVCCLQFVELGKAELRKRKVRRRKWIIHSHGHLVQLEDSHVFKGKFDLT
jgi:hypothetical protein